MKSYSLLGRDGRPYQSATPGTMGGHRRGKIYGRLDCPSASRAIAKGQYVNHRVFFADEEDAAAAGFRPCGSCLRPKYGQWLVDSGPQVLGTHRGRAAQRQGARGGVTSSAEASPAGGPSLLVRTKLSKDAAWQETSPSCELCGQPIGHERIEALPRATTCIACASLRKPPSRGRTCS